MLLARYARCTATLMLYSISLRSIALELHLLVYTMENVASIRLISPSGLVVTGVGRTIREAIINAIAAMRG